MSDIDEMRIRRLDFTVLLVFVRLMRERKAATVARRMGLTQSSISHSLKRLRDVFDDELFLRKPHGLEPTAVAIALEPRIRSVVELLRQAMAAPAPFDAGSAVRTIRVAAFDYELATIIPALIARLEREAPGLKIAARPLGRDDALHELAGGTVDMALGYFWQIGEPFLAERLFEETYRVVVRRGHPLLKGQLDLNRYADARHLIVSPAGDLAGIVDASLEQVGLQREVVASVPLFFPALAAVAGSDLIATLPTRLVSRYAPCFSLESLDVPIAVRPFAVSAVRHRRDARNPMHQWLVEAIADAIADTAADGSPAPRGQSAKARSQ